MQVKYSKKLDPRYTKPFKKTNNSDGLFSVFKRIYF